MQVLRGERTGCWSKRSRQNNSTLEEALYESLLFAKCLKFRGMHIMQVSRGERTGCWSKRWLSMRKIWQRHPGKASSLYRRIAPSSTAAAPLRFFHCRLRTTSGRVQGGVQNDSGGCSVANRHRQYLQEITKIPRRGGFGRLLVSLAVSKQGEGSYAHFLKLGP